MDEPGLPHARSGAAVSGRDGEVTATDLISIESTFVNMGELTWDVKESEIERMGKPIPNPPMLISAVSVAIVLRARAP